MSGGKRFKFTGTQIGLLIGYAATAIAVTGASNANPVVLQSTAHSVTPGSVVRLGNFVGMTELNDMVAVVLSVTENSITLADVDGTGYGTYVSGGELEVGQFSNFCELTDYNRSGGSSPEIQADSICSTAAEFELGLPDFGTTQLSYNFAPRTSVQGKLETAYRSGEVMAIKVKLPKEGGEMIQMGFVQQTTETAGRGGLWAATATIRNTGARVDLAAS